MHHHYYQEERTVCHDLIHSIEADLPEEDKNVASLRVALATNPSTNTHNTPSGPVDRLECSELDRVTEGSSCAVSLDVGHLRRESTQRPMGYNTVSTRGTSTAAMNTECTLEMIF